MFVVLILIIIVAMTLPVLVAPFRLFLNVIFPVLVIGRSFIDRHWRVDDRHADVVNDRFASSNRLIRCSGLVTTGYPVASDSASSRADGRSNDPTVSSTDLVAKQSACDSSYYGAAILRSSRLDGNLLVPAPLTRPFYCPVRGGACNQRHGNKYDALCALTPPRNFRAVADRQQRCHAIVELLITNYNHSHLQKHCL
ncbi:MAG: hypothetical protein QFF03_00570 [Pseudomonadota bacterium]|nr:hypothetical protein [Pseudomonadota bacterium]